jgi:hypothetical protein
MDPRMPICLICFYERSDGTFPPTIVCQSLEEALSIVTVQAAQIECVMLQGDVLHRDMIFEDREDYTRRKESFQDPIARRIFHRIVGSYNPSVHKMC